MGDYVQYPFLVILFGGVNSLAACSRVKCFAIRLTIVITSVLLLMQIVQEMTSAPHWPPPLPVSAPPSPLPWLPRCCCPRWHTPVFVPVCWGADRIPVPAGIRRNLAATSLMLRLFYGPEPYFRNGPDVYYTCFTYYIRKLRT